MPRRFGWRRQRHESHVHQIALAAPPGVRAGVGRVTHRFTVAHTALVGVVVSVGFTRRTTDGDCLCSTRSDVVAFDRGGAGQTTGR